MRADLQPVLQGNLVFYRQLVAKSFLKEDSICNVSNTNPFTRRRKFYCFRGITPDFVTDPDKGNPMSEYIHVILGRPSFTVTGLSEQGNEAEAEVSLKMVPVKNLLMLSPLIDEMDAKYPPLKKLFYGDPHPEWHDWRTPNIPEELTRSDTRHYYFKKFDSGWRVQKI